MDAIEQAARDSAASGADWEQLRADLALAPMGRAGSRARLLVAQRPPGALGGPWGFTALVNWLIYRRWPGER